MKKLDKFRRERGALNALILNNCNRDIKRFFALDNSAYRDGSLSSKTKEMMGLVASLVMRCDDCIVYHMDRCIEMDVNKNEFNEIFNIALIVGGSIVIPHIRRAYRIINEQDNIK